VIWHLQAGTRDLVFCEEQLLLAMRLVIEHGQAGPRGEIDHSRMARLLLGVTDVMVSGKQFESGPAEDIVVALALRRLGLPGVEQPLYELARWYNLLVTRARAAAGTAGALDLDALSRERTGIAIESFLGIAWMHAAPLYRPRSPADLGAASWDTALADLQHRYRDPDDCYVATLRGRFFWCSVPSSCMRR